MYMIYFQYNPRWNAMQNRPDKPDNFGIRSILRSEQRYKNNTAAKINGGSGTSDKLNNFLDFVEEKDTIRVQLYYKNVRFEHINV